MQTTVVAIATDRIVDWASFHTVFDEALGFPAFHGRNMNGWIDCLSCADDADAGMIAEPVSPGTLLTLRLDNVEDLQSRCPEQYAALIEAVAFVNFRRTESGAPPVLALLLSGWPNSP